MSEWKRISSAPKDSTLVFLCGGVYNLGDEEDLNRKICIGSYEQGQVWKLYTQHTDSKILVPTHWMPIPDPPKEAET